MEYITQNYEIMNFRLKCKSCGQIVNPLDIKQHLMKFHPKQMITFTMIR